MNIPQTLVEPFNSDGIPHLRLPAPKSRLYGKIKFLSEYTLRHLVRFHNDIEGDHDRIVRMFESQARELGALSANAEIFYDGNTREALLCLVIKLPDGLPYVIEYGYQ